jgi:hypothetical protein
MREEEEEVQGKPTRLEKKTIYRTRKKKMMMMMMMMMMMVEPAAPFCFFLFGVLRREKVAGGGGGGDRMQHNTMQCNAMEELTYAVTRDWGFFARSPVCKAARKQR